MDRKCKRIIDGKTYNTETATRVAGWTDDEHDPWVEGRHLYQNRHGAFFLYSFREAPDPEQEFDTIEPYTPDQAREWLEKNWSWNPDLIESLFGTMPDAGSGEVKYTLRLPESLRDRLAIRAKANQQSLNAWMVRCLEACASSKEASDAE